MDQSANNKRIAKNTILLYIRMFITLLVSLYTSRVLLQSLGVDDYGIYNIIGGVVVLFSFLSNAMTNSTQRYLNYNVGLNDDNGIQKVFCVSMQAHFVIALLVLLFAETIGLWFVGTQLNIPEDRMYAAHWVYQLSVVTTCVNIMRVPYNAVVIAYEKMSFFAYVSIAETVLKLLIVYMLLASGKVDRLILYSILLTITSFIIWFVYRLYCRKNYVISRYQNIKSKELFKELMSFTSWYLLGGVAMVGSRQGVNILLNIFFNVAVNAAVGIANQVKNAIYGFVTSFQTAFNPQIVKLYASNERSSLLQLIYRSTKFSFFLMFILSFPVILYSEELLSIWLVEVPQYAVLFTQLTIIATVFDAVSAPLWTVIGATGKVKYYQIIVSVIILIDIPLAYIALKFGYNPISVFVINVLINVFAYIFRLLYLKKYLEISIFVYVKKVIFPCVGVALFSIPLPILLATFSEIHWILQIILSVILSVLFVFALGLDVSEKSFIKRLIRQKISI